MRRVRSTSPPVAGRPVSESSSSYCSWAWVRLQGGATGSKIKRTNHRVSRTRSSKVFSGFQATIGILAPHSRRRKYIRPVWMGSVSSRVQCRRVPILRTWPSAGRKSFRVETRCVRPSTGLGQDPRLQSWVADSRDWTRPRVYAGPDSRRAVLSVCRASTALQTATHCSAPRAACAIVGTTHS